MKKNNLLNFFIIIFILALPIKSNAEIIILDLNDFDLIPIITQLDLEKLLLTRNYVYNQETYKKYRITDLSVKK